MKLDPYPYYCIDGPSCRHSRKLAPSTIFAPRADFSQIRDDYPDDYS